MKFVSNRVVGTIPCDACNGFRYMWIKGKRVKCPECFGEGILTQVESSLEEGANDSELGGSDVR